MVLFPTVLLVDDDEVSSYITTRMLVKSGLVGTIEVFTSAEEAFQKLINNKESLPSLMLIDLQLPLMSGVEFLELMVKHHLPLSQSVIIPCTCSVIPSELEKLQALGYNNILMKPITRQKVEELFLNKN